MAAAQGASAQIAAMAKAAQQVDQASQTLGAIRGQVANIVAGTNSGYQSQGATVFRNAMDQWNADFQKVVDGLTRIHEALTATGRSYQATVDHDAASANSIFTALNGTSGA